MMSKDGPKAKPKEQVPPESVKAELGSRSGNVSSYEYNDYSSSSYDYYGNSEKYKETEVDSEKYKETEVPPSTTKGDDDPNRGGPCYSKPIVINEPKTELKEGEWEKSPGLYYFPSIGYHPVYTYRTETGKFLPICPNYCLPTPDNPYYTCQAAGDEEEESSSSSDGSSSSDESEPEPPRKSHHRRTRETRRRMSEAGDRRPAAPPPPPRDNKSDRATGTAAHPTSKNRVGEKREADNKADRDGEKKVDKTDQGSASKNGPGGKDLDKAEPGPGPARASKDKAMEKVNGSKGSHKPSQDGKRKKSRQAGDARSTSQASSYDYYSAARTPSFQRRMNHNHPPPAPAPGTITNGAMGMYPQTTQAMEAKYVSLPHQWPPRPQTNTVHPNDDEGLNFMFKPRTDFATEVSFTIEPRKKPMWQKMMSCGFRPMITCAAPPFSLPPNYAQHQRSGYYGSSDESDDDDSSSEDSSSSSGEDGKNTKRASDGSSYNTYKQPSPISLSPISSSYKGSRDTAASGSKKKNGDEPPKRSPDAGAGKKMSTEGPQKKSPDAGAGKKMSTEGPQKKSADGSPKPNSTDNRPKKINTDGPQKQITVEPQNKGDNAV